MKLRGALAGRGHLLCGLLIAVLQHAGTLEVQMGSQMIAFLNQDVWLPCNISGYNNHELDIKKMAVTWYLRTPGEKMEKLLYSVVSGEHSSHRRGLQMNESQLKRGNAELFLPQIQLNEEGMYICSVTVTPDKAEGTKIMEIVAQPTVILSPREVTIERGREKTLSCAVVKFYPVPPQNLGWLAGLISILIATCALAALVYYWWFMKIQPTVLAFIGNTELKHMEDSKLQCLISGFRPKPLDVAFSITQSNNEKRKIFSWNTEASDAEDRDEDYPLLKKCEAIKIYATLKKEKRGIFQVSCEIHIVPHVKQLDKFELLLEVRHGALPHSLLVETASFNVIAPPLLDPIWCSTDMPRLEEMMTLYCKIHSYFPQTIDVHWLIDDEQLPEEPFLSEPMKATDGLFFCTSSIKYLPKAADSGKRFLCKTNLRGSHQCKESAWMLKTVVCTPKVSQIDCEPGVPECGKVITLSCSLKDFNPPRCDICWRRGFEKLTHTQINTEEPYLDTTSNLYCMKSQASFTPKPEDHGVEFVVEVNHCNKTTRNAYKLMLKGFPKISDIIVHPSDAEYGKPLSLTCRVMDFYPKDINIQWFRGDDLINKDVLTEGPTEDQNNSFSLLSRLQLEPTALDYDKTICFRVTHKKLTKPTTKSVYLKLPAKHPVVSEIKATSEQAGKVSLETSITNFAPCYIRVVWYKDWKKISEVNDPSDIHIEENKLCSFTSKIQISIKETDIGKTIRCEVHHRQTNSFKEQTFVLKSKDFCGSLEQIPLPLVHNHIGTSRSYSVTNEEVLNPLKIDCVTSSPKPGENVTLRCFVHGKRAKEACVSWYKGIFPVDEGIQNTTCNDGSGFISYVTFKTEKEERECEIKCEVSVDVEHWEETYILDLRESNIVRQ
ncbi:natural cytotoxicity triggering receptor 3 ligand 1 isoform X2 [Eublepharis macularius]|uniref:Natural cytotoxicity triggering receptor 3 ligand 1 isoform X2 n=1 Tax=Eublepharis macularius TaxID=481883 RepID=A0AA97IWF1_EUBMA|nr:natural cytotoxicity triggering receptor 3 ligand 1 isoform X2 [Eublepharis macularius]